jgi:hypothetical protein
MRWRLLAVLALSVAPLGPTAAFATTTEPCTSPTPSTSCFAGRMGPG